MVEVGEHALEPAGLVGDGGGGPFGRRAAGRAVAQGLGEAADDGERRAQVVAYVGQQLLLRLTRGVDLGGHGVEGGAGLGDLRGPVTGSGSGTLPRATARRLRPAAAAARPRSG